MVNLSVTNKKQKESILGLGIFALKKLIIEEIIKKVIFFK